jgi:major membrane immunogen (membrane-anchored lipoprotein)
MVPGNWVCKKSRTKRKVSTTEENKDVVCGNKVSSDGDNEAVSHKIASAEKTDRTTKV